MNQSVRNLLADIRQHFGIVAYSTAGSLIQASLLPLIILPFLAHQLSHHDFGQLTVLLSLVNYVITVVGANLTLNVYRRQKNYSGPEKARFFGRLFWLCTIIAFGALLLLIGAYDEISARWKLQMTFLQALPFFIFMAGMTVSSMAAAFLSSKLLFKSLFQARLALFIGSFATIATYYLWTDSFWSAGFAVGPIVFLIALLVVIRRLDMVRFDARPNFGFVGSISRDTALFTLAGVALNFVVYGDRWLMAESDIPYETVAAYSIAVQANMLTIFATEQFSGLFIPLISNLRSATDMTPALVKKLFLVLLMLILGMPIAGSVVGPLYVKLLYGNEYWQEVKVIFFVILAGVSLYPIQMLARGFLIRLHPITLNLSINALAVVVMIVAIYLLKDTLGVMGFAIARALAIGTTGVGFFIAVFLPLLRRAYAGTKQ